MPFRPCRSSSTRASQSPVGTTVPRSTPCYQAAARCVAAYREHMAYLATQPLVARSYERLDLNPAAPDRYPRRAASGDQTAAKGGSSDSSARYGGNRIAEKGSWTEGRYHRQDQGQGKRPSGASPAAIILPAV